MKAIGAVMDLFRMIDANGFLKGKITLGPPRIKSISSFSSKGIYYFPMIMSDQISLEETKMIAKAMEKTYAAFVANCISLIPFHRIRAEDRGSIDNYLKIFHQNMGISEPTDLSVTVESAMSTEAALKQWHKDWVSLVETNHGLNLIDDNPPVKPIHESFQKALPPIMSYRIKTMNEDTTVNIGGATNDMKQNDIDGQAREGSSFKTFDRNVFQDQEMKKANEMLPTMIKANIGFVVEETNEVIQKEILVGVKTYVRRMRSAALVNELYDTIINKRKFLRFIKIMSGEEEESLLDLILGLKEIKGDVQKKIDGQHNEILLTSKGRKRMASLTAGALRNNYNPNLTLVMTMNEVNLLKEKGIDLFSASHTEMLIKELFFLGFVILDQTNEIAYIQFESHNYSFQEYPYSTLEREISTNDRMMRELYRTLQR